MNKKATNYWLIGGIIVIAILVFIVMAQTGLLNFGKTLSGVNLQVPSGCSSSILSIDKVSLSNTGTDLGSDVFQITLSGREGGQCVYGFLDANELAQKIGDVLGKDVQTKYSSPLAITLQRTSTNAYYKISDTLERTIKKYKYQASSSPQAVFSGITWDIAYGLCKIGTLSQSSCSKQCTTAGYQFANCEHSLTSGFKANCYCWSFPIDGNVYGFNKDRLQEQLNVQIITGDGQTKSAVIDTDSKRDVYDPNVKGILSIGDPSGLYATFEGFWQGTQLMPDANAKVYDSAGVRKIVTSSAGLSATQEPLCSNQVSYPKIESCMTNYNTILSNGFGTPSEFSGATISGGYIKLPLSKDTFYPIIKVQVQAKWLGIYEPVAEPQLSNCQGVNLDFRNGKTGYATYNLGIKSGTGDQGTFNIYADCSGCASGSSVSNTQIVVGTNIVSGQISLNQNTNANGNGNCLIKAEINRLGFTAADTCNIPITCIASCALESETCASNSCCEGLQCNSGVCGKVPGLEVCNNQMDDNGNGLTDCFDAQCKGSIYCGGNKNCSSDEKLCSDGVCRKSCGGDKCSSCAAWGSNIFKKAENKCTATEFLQKKWYNPASWVLSGLTKQTIWCPILFIATLIVFIFSLLFGQQLFMNFNVIADKPWLTWLLASIIALGIAFAVYMAFVIGLIVFVVFIIIKIIISGTVGKFTRAVRRI